VRALSALFALELGRRRHHLLFGAALGFVALVLPWFGSTDPSAARAIAAGIFAFVHLLAGALFAGSALFVDDLAEGRSGFLVGRPFRTWQLLCGRVAAVLVAVTGAVILTLLPAILAGAEVLGDSGSLAVVFSTIAGPSDALLLPAAEVIRPLALALAVLGLIGLGNALGLMARVRGGWLLLDLTTGVVLSAALLQAADELALPGSGALRYLVLPATLVLAGLALAVATSAQVASGRTDGQRAHRAFSVTWFAAAVALSIATIGFSRWYVRPFPSDLVRPFVFEHSAGFLEVHGVVWRPAPLEASFLVDRRSGRTARLQVLGWRGMPIATANAAVVDEDRTVYWWKRDRRSRNRVLHRLDLTSTKWEPEATTVELEPGWLAGPISPKGTVAYRVKRDEAQKIELAADRTDGAGALLVRRLEIPGLESFHWIGATERSARALVLVEESSSWARAESEPAETPPATCPQPPSPPFEEESSRRLRAVLLDIELGSDGDPFVRPLTVGVQTFGEDDGVAVGGPKSDRSILLRLGLRGWARVDPESGKITGCIRYPEGSDSRSLHAFPRLLPEGRALLLSRIGSECRWTLFDSDGQVTMTLPHAGNGYDSGFVVGEGDRILHAFSMGSPSFNGAHAEPLCPPARDLGPGWYLRTLDPSAGTFDQEGPLSQDALLRRLFTSGYARDGGNGRKS